MPNSFYECVCVACACSVKSRACLVLAAYSYPAILRVQVSYRNWALHIVCNCLSVWLWQIERVDFISGIIIDNCRMNKNYYLVNLIILKEWKAILQNFDSDLIYNTVSVLWNITFHVKSFAYWCKLQL